MEIERELESLRRDVQGLRRTRYVYLAMGALLCLPLWLQASAVGPLTTFSNGVVANAAAVNGNFDALSGAVNDNDGRLTTLGSGLATLRTDFDQRPLRPQNVVVWHDGDVAQSGTTVCVNAGYRGCAWEIRLDTSPNQLANCTEGWECPNSAGNATNCRVVVCTR